MKEFEDKDFIEIADTVRGALVGLFGLDRVHDFLTKDPEIFFELLISTYKAVINKIENRN